MSLSANSITHAYHEILNSQEIKPQLTNNNKLNYSEINKVLPKKNKSKTDFALRHGSCSL